MKKIIITENQLKKILNESYYDSNKLYSKQYIESVTRNAPRDIKNIVRGLEVMGCIDGSGNLSQCVKIPEVLFIYVSGRY
jgi:hypothetical protein